MKSFILVPVENVLRVIMAMILLITVTPAGATFQSGPHVGAVYSAAMVVDEITDNVYYTGMTYDPSLSAFSTDSDTTTTNPTTVAHCFVAKSTGSSAGFSTIKTYVGDTAADACRSLVILSSAQIAVVGTAELGSSMLASNTMDVTDLPQLGFAITLETDSLTTIAGLTLSTESRVPYPQAVVTDPTDSDRLYVATMTATQDAMESSSDEYPNWTHLFQYGKSFELTVQALQYQEGSTGGTFDGILDLGNDNQGAVSPLLQSSWVRPFPVLDSTEYTDGVKPSVYVGGMMWKQGVGLIVAGSTAAFGEAYGPATGGDEDGFVTVLDPSTGDLGNQAVTGTGEAARTNERHGTGEYDIVIDLCDDPYDDTAFFIVGATKGDMLGRYPEDENLQPPAGSLQAFVRKLSASTLQTIWTVQLGAWIDIDTRTNAAAFDCIVNSEGNLYLVGQVSGGASMVEANTVHVSQGGQDIWVAQINTKNGGRNWIQQVGSAGDESLARNSPIGLDSNGNAIVFGDTTGSLYRERTVTPEADLFVITFDQDTGTFQTTVEGLSPDTTQVLAEDDDAVDDDVVDDDDQSAVLGNVDVDSLSDTRAVPADSQLHQSGPNGGALYASSLIYDPTSDLAVILGISYTSTLGAVTSYPSCLVAKVQISSMETKTYRIVGSGDVLEACRGLAMTYSEDGIDSSTIVLVGNSEPTGLYASSDPQDLQSGFGMSLSGDDLRILNGASLLSERIPYPEALVVDGNDIYVASMNSNDFQQNANDQVGSEFPNWTYLAKYGQGFTMTIQKLSLPNFDSVWIKTYPVTPEDDGTVFSVLVGGMILKPGVGLVVVGSTRAKGDAYGDAVGDDEDGFITLINPDDGSLVSDRTNNIRIGSDLDDVISEICDVPGDADSVIVVGATTGDINGIRDPQANALLPSGSLQWYVKRINLLNLQEEWTIQGGAIAGQGGSFYDRTSVYAVGCHVEDDTVYVGGTVENGASLLDGRAPLPSKGGNDVWIASLSLDNGDSNWIRQFGSVGDDQLARNGGITTDRTGGVLIYGDTTGALYRDRSVGANADIFLAVLSASTGEFGTKGESTGESVKVSNITPTAAPVAPPVMDEALTEDRQTIPDDIRAIQLGPDSGPAYAGGMDYDSFFNSLYLTGATYGGFSDPNHDSREGSQCFFARVDLPNLEVVQRETYSVAGEMEACTAVAANAFDSQRNVIVLGTAEPGGLLTELAKNDKAKQYGFAMDITLQTKFEFLGGAVLGDGLTPVVFPVALVSDEENFWTVSMISGDDKVSPDYDKIRDKRYPNFTNGGVVKYGSSYHMNVESYKYARAGDGNAFTQGASQNFESEWSKSFDFAAERDRDDPGLLIGGMIGVDDKLVVVGSIHSDGIVNGMIAKIDRSIGELDTTGSKSVEYYGVDEESDTWIMNACADKGDSNYFYIVGATQESNSKDHRNKIIPWAAKIETSSLKTIWTKKFYLRSNDRKDKQAASFYGCAVVPSENLLYVAGTVEDGAVVRFALASDNEMARPLGGDDLVVAQLSTSIGVEKWIRQIGSNGDDRLARSGGVMVDANGNAIIYGETTGTLFRDRSNDDRDEKQNSDVFVMLLDKKRGIHQPPLKGPKLAFGGHLATEFFNEFTKNKKSAGAIVGFVILALVLAAGLYFVSRRFFRLRRKTKDPISMYDAADADLGFIDDADGANSSTGAFGLFRKKTANRLDATQNLSYRDDPDKDETIGGLLASGDMSPSGGLPGSFHKTYSDLPQSGKNII